MGLFLVWVPCALAFFGIGWFAQQVSKFESQKLAREAAEDAALGSVHNGANEFLIALKTLEHI